MKMHTVALVAALVFGTQAMAQAVRVEGVQYPAWLERGGRSVPLSPGMQLQARDKLVTGSNARVQLRLSEGSTVKLGQDAQLAIERVDEGNVFKAGLSVLAGAFRFTTDPASKSRVREVSIKARNVTAGVRGTDLWGKSTEERDLVCLIEGRITVGAEGHPTVTLEQPLDFYQKPRGAGAPQVSKVDVRQLEEWSRETEISADGAAARADGGWRVVVATMPKRDDARTLAGRLRAAGYPAEVIAAEKYFVIQIPRFAGEAQARSAMSNLRGMQDVTLPKVAPMP